MSLSIAENPNKGNLDDFYELPETLLKECKKSFDLFDLDMSGRINSGLIQAYLSTVGQPNRIHYLLGGIENLGDEIKYEDYLSHIKSKLKNASKEEDYKKIANFVKFDRENHVEIEEIKTLARELGIDLNDNELKEVVDRIKVIDAPTE